MLLLENLPSGSARWAMLPGGLDTFLKRGVSLRPLVVVTAGVHGDEYEGPAAVAELARLLRGETLAGSVVAIPVANSMAWRAAQRTSPEDGLNLARTFPGHADGSCTERLAAAIFDVARLADFLIDLHSGGVEYNFVPLAGFYGEPVAGNPSFDAARRFGLPYAWQVPPTDGVLSHECWKLGITAIGCEYLGAGQLSEAGVSNYVTGILSCLKMWGIYQNGVALPSAGEVVTGDWMLSSAEGIFRAHCRLGDEVAAGQSLAKIHDERGAVRQCFAAEVSGRVLGLRSKAYIRAGDWGVLIGRDA
jgi:N-alpha-acetyl-L-2,4-diaminobutyrate deacetylase